MLKQLEKSRFFIEQYADCLLFLQAYKAWVRKNGDEPLLPGIKRTNDQMFFVSFGQV